MSNRGISRLGQGAKLFGTYQQRKKRQTKYGKPMIRKRFRSGYDRTGGLYYGRFSGPDPEAKFLDTTLSFLYDLTGECSTSAGTGNIHIVPQDTSSSGREGRQIIIKSIQMRGYSFFAPGAGAISSTNIYLYVILDSQCNGANPAITDVFTTTNMHSNFLNLANSKRFKILKKFKWNLTSSAGVTTAYGPVSKICQWYKRCNIPITYDSTAATGAVGTTRQNNICLAYGSDGQTDDLVTFNGAARIRYVG